MNRMINMQRIAPPAWAPDFARHRILLQGPRADGALMDEGLHSSSI